MDLYVVQVTHRVGPETAGTRPCLVTPNAAVALTAAFGIEERYTVVADGDGAQVFRMQDGVMDPAEMFLGGEFAVPRALAFIRIRDHRDKSGWFVNWYDKGLERTHGRVFAPLTA